MVSVLAHHLVGVQGDLLAEPRQPVERGHRRFHLVADAADVEQQVWRVLLAQAPLQPADQLLASPLAAARCMRLVVS